MKTKEALDDLKNQLIDKIIKSPLDFTDIDFRKLVQIGLNSSDINHKEPELNFEDLRKMIIRIFDINETTLKEQSNASVGLLGKLNKYSSKIRLNRYRRKINSGFRDFRNPNKKVIVAEGDSWFQFPFFIKDIIDWLIEEPNYAVYCLAYGGDWFTNILNDEKYIEELSIHRPDVFLISGGGNDFVGSNRIATMVNGKESNQALVKTKIAEISENLDAKFKADLELGYQYISPSFYSFLWTLKSQYWKLFNRLESSGKFENMRIITQGYDYVLPSFKIGYKKWYSLQPIVNILIGTGKWLKHPLMIQGIKNDDISKCILKAMIYELNLVFIDLANNQGFKNVFHIDCRGVATSQDDWWDELHLHSEGFEKIALAYKACINKTSEDKVVKVVNG